MISPQFTIAKAKFSACLLKPDITTINRDQVSAGLDRIDQVVAQCSSTNIEVWVDDAIQERTRR